MSSSDDIKILGFIDQTGEEYRVAAFLKLLLNKELEVDYFPICLIYDEVNKVVRIAN